MQKSDLADLKKIVTFKFVFDTLCPQTSPEIMQMGARQKRR